MKKILLILFLFITGMAYSQSVPTYISTSDPTVNSDYTAGFTKGFFWLNTSDSTLFICTSDADGAAVWIPTIADAFVDVMSTRGDMVYRNSSNVTDRLPIGSNGQVLTSDGTDAGWDDPNPTVSIINQLISPPAPVTWNSLLIFDVAHCEYYIQGEYYTSSSGQLTLDAAHATLDRIDVIAVDTNGVAVKISGTAASDPAKPTVDPLSQLELTSILVQAGETEPSIDVELVYDENEEWTTASTPVADVTVDFASAETPTPPIPPY